MRRIVLYCSCKSLRFYSRANLVIINYYYIYLYILLRRIADSNMETRDKISISRSNALTHYPGSLHRVSSMCCCVALLNMLSLFTSKNSEINIYSVSYIIVKLALNTVRCGYISDTKIVSNENIEFY
jgi:hypothetical protein